jgi:hypothetical protein
MENFQKIDDNMNEAQVRAILGSPTEIVNGNFVKTRSLVWKHGLSRIEITFLDGRIVGRHVYMVK